MHGAKLHEITEPPKDLPKEGENNKMIVSVIVQALDANLELNKEVVTRFYKAGTEGD